MRKSCGAKVLPSWGCVLRLAVLCGGYVHMEKKTPGKCPYSALRICSVSRDAFSRAACFCFVTFDDTASAVRRTVFLNVGVATRLACGALRRCAAVFIFCSRVSKCLLGRFGLMRVRLPLWRAYFSNVSSLTAAPPTRRRSWRISLAL